MEAETGQSETGRSSTIQKADTAFEAGPVLDHIVDETVELCDELQDYAMIAEMVDIATGGDSNGRHQSGELLRASSLTLAVANWASALRRDGTAPPLRDLSPAPSSRMVGARLGDLVLQAERLHARAARLEMLFAEDGRTRASPPREARLRLVSMLASGDGG